MIIEGSNNPGNRVHVDDFGKMQTRSVTISEQSQKSLSGDSYNINTSDITLTSDVETPVFYFKNDTEDDSIVVPRIFITSLDSDAPGAFHACIYSGITGGTILAASDLAPQNFNFGSSKLPGTTLKIGATGETFVGGQRKPEFLFPSEKQRSLIGFEAIVLPRGASMVLTVTPPTGSTSWVIQAGANFYIDGDFE